jgi:hypothetical protein
MVVLLHLEHVTKMLKADSLRIKVYMSMYACIYMIRACVYEHVCMHISMKTNVECRQPADKGSIVYCIYEHVCMHISMNIVYMSMYACI